MLRAIGEIRPVWVVGENVRGLVNWNGGMVFDQVQADLEAQGYEVIPVLLPACGVNAPHRRERIWFVAHSTSNRRLRNGQRVENENRQTRSEYAGNVERRFEGLCVPGVTTDTDEQYGNLSRFRTGEVSQFETSELQHIRADWGAFPTQSPICFRNDGLSFRLDSSSVFNGIKPRQPALAYGKWRTESVKGAGNAIVPQVVYQIFKAIESLEITY
jgi:DNA (cytosine-5)-methyltransferase 1